MQYDVDYDIELGYDNKAYKRFSGKTFYTYHIRTSTKHKHELCRGILEIKPNSDRHVHQVEAHFIDTELTYTGYFILNYKHAFTYLRGYSHRDRALMILNNPDSKRTYIGGIGLIVSTSEGSANSFPCSQLILLSDMEISEDHIDDLTRYLPMGVEADWLFKLDKDCDKEYYEFLDDMKKMVL